MFDATDNPLKLNKRTGSVTRRNILHPNWQVREENRHLHPRARSYKFGSVESPQTTNSSSDGGNSLFTAAGLGSYPPETGGIKAASSWGEKRSPAARYSQFLANRTEPRSEASAGKSPSNLSQNTASLIPVSSH
jgi:hypothetical protein